MTSKIVGAAALAAMAVLSSLVGWSTQRTSERVACIFDAPRVEDWDRCPVATALERRVQYALYALSENPEA